MSDAKDPHWTELYALALGNPGQFVHAYLRREAEINQLNGIIQGLREAEYRYVEVEEEEIVRVVHDADGGLKPLHDPACHAPGDILGPY